jgi:RNA polymerase sigma-70 factor (ECF subfamily)
MDDLMSQDATDLQAARHGGPDGHQAFARIFDRHAPVVRALCRASLGSADPAAADDALQETFIRAFRMLDRLDRAEGLRPWLYGIARNVCNESRRSARRRHRHEGVAAMNHALHPLPAMAADPPAAVAHAEDLDRLTDAIDRLPDQERLAIHLFYMDPDPIAAAKEALGLSRSGFYKLLARARDHLASTMKEVRA